MEDEATVLGTPDVPKQSQYPGLSPWQAALTYGGAAASVAGPLGLLVGLGAGLVSKRMRDNYLDRQAQASAALRGEYKALTDELDSELRLADPDERRLLEHSKRLATDGWYRLQQGDGTGRELIDQANTIARGIMQADSQARKSEEANVASFQRELVSNAAKDYRQQFQTNMDQYKTIDSQAMRVLDLVAQPDFDPNKPFNKAILAELLSTGIGGFYKDAPDALDAVAQGSNALSRIPLAGQYLPDVVQGITTAIKAKDFKVSAEDYNRIALNMRKYAQTYASQRMSMLGQQSRKLDEFARRTGSIPGDYSLADYVSGGISDLQILPAPTASGMSTERRVTPRDPEWLQNPRRGLIQRPTRRPTN